MQHSGDQIDRSLCGDFVISASGVHLQGMEIVGTFLTTRGELHFDTKLSQQDCCIVSIQLRLH